MAETTTETTTVIRNCRWLIAWDGPENQQVFLRGADLAFRGSDIIHCGPDYKGPAGLEIDGRDRMVMPGLIDIHSHPMSEPMNKGFSEEVGSKYLGMSSLYEYLPIFRPDEVGTAASAEVAYCELLLSGVTTLVDMSVPWDGWQALMAQSGLRGVLAPMFRSGYWYTPNGHEVLYEWDEAGGRAGMARTLQIIQRAQQDPSGRLGGMLTPSQVDTCTEDLLREAAAES
ncbi:MAG: N-ethylammeline chlorohydrolase, partial [Rhodospirillaceae bacterium]|nr:N-ethylammeline chlorohydrolase [Rhodospirillaceae bacterium]